MIIENCPRFLDGFMSRMRLENKNTPEICKHFYVQQWAENRDNKTKKRQNAFSSNSGPDKYRSKIFLNFQEVRVGAVQRWASSYSWCREKKETYSDENTQDRLEVLVQEVKHVPNQHERRMSQEDICKSSDLPGIRKQLMSNKNKYDKFYLCRTKIKSKQLMSDKEMNTQWFERRTYLTEEEKPPPASISKWLKRSRRCNNIAYGAQNHWIVKEKARANVTCTHASLSRLGIQYTTITTYRQATSFRNEQMNGNLKKRNNSELKDQGDILAPYNCITRLQITRILFTCSRPELEFHREVQPQVASGPAGGSCTNSW